MTSNQYGDIFWLQINWLFTIWNSEHVMGIWQKYVTATVKNHKNIQKLYLFDKISDINNKLLTSSKKWTFLYICGKNCIQGVNILSTPDPQLGLRVLKNDANYHFKTKTDQPQNFDIRNILSYYWSCYDIEYKYFQLGVNHWFSSLSML